MKRAVVKWHRITTTDTHLRGHTRFPPPPRFGLQPAPTNLSMIDSTILRSAPSITRGAASRHFHLPARGIDLVYTDLVDDTDVRGSIDLSTANDLLVPVPLYVPKRVTWVVDSGLSPVFVCWTTHIGSERSLRSLDKMMLGSVGCFGKSMVVSCVCRRVEGRRGVGCWRGLLCCVECEGCGGYGMMGVEMVVCELVKSASSRHG
jgi:hypothetical protein